jgi:GTP-binding protein
MSEEPPPARVVDAVFEGGAVNAGGLPPPALPEIAFAGRSNVGKSSLMNALVQRKNLVRTSKTPGATRQINLFKVTLADGLVVRLVDLPGYGYAKLSKAQKATWGPMLEGYLTTRATLRAVVLLVDARRGLETDDLDLLAFLAAPRGSTGSRAVGAFVVATKLDKLTRANQRPALESIRRASGIMPIGCSAVTEAGREALWARIRREVAGVV